MKSIWVCSLSLPFLSPGHWLKLRSEGEGRESLSPSSVVSTVRKTQTFCSLPQNEFPVFFSVCMARARRAEAKKAKHSLLPMSRSAKSEDIIQGECHVSRRREKKVVKTKTGWTQNSKQKCRKDENVVRRSTNWFSYLGQFKFEQMIVLSGKLTVFLTSIYLFRKKQQQKQESCLTACRGVATPLPPPPNLTS